MATLKGRAPSSQAAHCCCAVRVQEDVGALRRMVTELASRCPEVGAAEVALVATELAGNLVEHTTAGGYVLVREVEGGIELLSVDRGPGMRPAERLAAERLAAERLAARSYPGCGDQGAFPPRAGGLGAGLARITRMATTFDLYSSQPEGTVVLARVLSRPPESGWCRWGAVNVPFGGFGASGDAWAVATNGLLAALVVDGLGHGSDAAAASRMAISVFEGDSLRDPEGFVRRAHEAMRATRGGVLGICTIDRGRESLRFAGIGNITGQLLVDGKSQSLVSRPGSLGTHRVLGRIDVVQHRWSPGATLALASDGLGSGWDLGACPEILAHDPAVVAATLQRGYGRATDDATVLVVSDLEKRQV